MSGPVDLAQGTLDPPILKAVALEPMHGWAVAQRIKQLSSDSLQVQREKEKADWERLSAAISGIARMA